MKNFTIALFLLIVYTLIVLSLHKHHNFVGTCMKNKSLLEPYKQKRNFTKTTEPTGIIHKKEVPGEPIFVIQKHEASHLHYDFRIEIEGVLKSWAVPKGPSTDPKVKHLAVPTDDHPLEYALFEGTIPEGEYGAGTVMVWDIGTFENIKKEYGKIKSLEQSYADGHLEIFLYGKKLKGGYSLIRIQGSSYKNTGWLLIKMRDQFANIPAEPLQSEQNSALTGRTMEQIKEETNG